MEDRLTFRKRSRSPDPSFQNVHGVTEPFCACLLKDHEFVCTCGEEDTEFEWAWDLESKSLTSELSIGRRQVTFHQRYSSGTAAVRGETPMRDHQYYWEVKMISPVYGTDMMVGVGTANVELKKYRDTFFSLLGSDSQSWGLSYSGMIHHKGQKQNYAPKFGQGSIIGVHLDAWNGTLSFFNNRQFLGVAFKNLHGKTLYPMASSTAARSGMKIVKCHSVKTSLQYLCLQQLRKAIPPDQSILEALHLPPGLSPFLKNNLGWLVSSVVMKTSNYPNCTSHKRSCYNEDYEDLGEFNPGLS